MAKDPTKTVMPGGHTEKSGTDCGTHNSLRLACSFEPPWGRIGVKEASMIELTEEQAHAVAEQKAPLRLVNPKTQEVFVLVRQDVYDLTCSIVGGGAGRVWDDTADDDLIQKRL